MLTEVALKSLTLPPGKPRLRVKDGGGLFIELVASGGKWWRFRYSFAGTEKMLSFGTYPTVSLRDARLRRDEARGVLARGADPSAERRAAKIAAVATAAGDSFETVTREWHAKQSPKWSEVHRKKVIYLFEKNIFPGLGKRRISEIDPPELLAVLRKIEDRDAVYTAKRMRGKCGEVFRYAIATGRAKRDSAADLRGAMGAVTETHRAAVLDPVGIGGILRVHEAYAKIGSPVVAAAMRILPYVFVRPGELRCALWKDVDLKTREWRFTASKTGMQMIVPLSSPVVETLKALHAKTGSSPYVFPSARSRKRPMCDNAISAAYARCELDGEQTAHGWRAIARTHLDETLQFRVDIIHAQLGHRVVSPNGRAYNRTTFLPERRQMMDAWAAWLDGLRESARGQKKSEPGQ